MKYKILVVDDEPFIAKTIKQMIETSHTGFEVVDIAYNGEMALQKIDLLNPDIVFSDIRMPVMDGLELVSKLKEKNYPIIPVILSGYQEFEYVRKALQEGVMDYLLKPLSSDTLIPLLDNIYTRLNLQMRTLQIEALKIIFHSSAHDINNINIKKLFNYNSYAYMLICSGSYSRFPCSWITPSEEMWHNIDIHSVLSKYISPLNYWFVSGAHPNEKLLLMPVVSITKQEINELCTQLHQALLLFNLPITSVVGTVDGDIELLNATVMKARMTLNRTISFGLSSCIITGSEQSPDISYKQTDFFDNSTKSYFLMLFENNQYDNLKQEIKKIFDLLEKNEAKQLVLEKKLRDILSLFYTSLEQSPEVRIEELDLALNEIISNSYTYKSLFEGFLQIIDDIFEYKKSDFKKHINQKELVNKIEQYINSNYTNQINLQNLSNNFGLVAPYLSRIFKEVKGLSPNDYIMQLRIERIKTLLNIQPQISLKDIAESTGFNDQFYMSKVFKIITGVTPSQYREK